jgi:DNA primase
MSDQWIDYKDIKAGISLEMILNRYGLLGKLRKSGSNLVGCCPIHQGSNDRQFSVNLERNLFNCFGNCKAGGNVLDFVSRMERISVRESALLIKTWFPNLIPESKEDQIHIKSEKPISKQNEGPDKRELNPPLEFELKSIDTEHPFFNEHGIEPGTVKHFGLGFCSKGIMKGRIAIPIHDEQGRLVAYCGCAVTPEQIEKHGQYKFPAKFVKSAIVYNLYRQNGETLILVQDFLSVFRLHGSGFPNTVSLMEPSLSDLQKRLIVDRLGPQGKLILLFRNDEEGQKARDTCLSRFSRQVFVKVIDIGPDADNLQALKHLL